MNKHLPTWFRRGCMTFEATHKCLCLQPMTCYKPYPTTTVITTQGLGMTCTQPGRYGLSFPPSSSSSSPGVRTNRVRVCNAIHFKSGSQMQLNCCFVCFICHNDNEDDDLIDVCILERCSQAIPSNNWVTTYLRETVLESFIPSDTICQFSCMFTSNGLTPNAGMLAYMHCICSGQSIPSETSWGSQAEGTGVKCIQ